jgi:predicted alpha-1,2-mannosidase
MRTASIAAIALLYATLISCESGREGIFVKPLIGTDFRTVEVEGQGTIQDKGQVMPAVGVPHGMTNWVAQTNATEKKCLPPYYYSKAMIQGFRASHWMNGSCTQDYGSVTIMPVQGTLKTEAEERASSFDHSEETATPSSYSVKLKDYDIDVRMAGLSRSGIFSFHFNQDGDHFIVIEPNSDEGEAFIKIDSEKNEVYGYNPVHRIYQGYGKKAGFSGYFVIRFHDEFDEYGAWDGNGNLKGADAANGHCGAWVKLSSDAAGEALVKIGTSFTDIDHARMNLDSEISGWSYRKVQKASEKEWDMVLGHIQIEGQNEDDKIKFYTALYETMFLPREFSDVDGSYPKFDGGGKIMKMENGVYYADFSQWDTFRAVHPLLTILCPSIDGQMAESLVLKGEQGGWLPIFPSWNSYTSEMIGDHCISMIGDAILKDIKGFDYEAAYSLMRRNAFQPNTDSASYKDGKGRRALESYLRYGFIPLEDEVRDAFHRKEQVSRTLEYAYDDFVLAQVAKKLGKTEDYEVLSERARNWRNVIDSESGYARGRHSDSTWAEPFDPFSTASFICEGTPYHYTWFVPHDVNGLVEHMGGRERFIERLDKFFDGGYYWHGNEPGHHIAYLYPFVGESWKTQKLIHEIEEKEYKTAPDGLSGNDDAGQMSAWLVFSMMGFYPVCPGSLDYVIGSPSFDRCTISLENGKKFTIESPGASEGRIYIQSATLNGEPYDKAWISHADIMNGGRLVLEMGPQPKKDR